MQDYKGAETLKVVYTGAVPDAYRVGREQAIPGDLRGKLPALDTRDARVVDVGCGCGDLAIALAVASSRLDVAVPSRAVVLGEVGLGGEIRSVPNVTRRLAEAARIGFSHAIVPASTPDTPGIGLLRVHDLRDAIEVALRMP